MAKAHEEKIRAVAAADEKNKKKISELESEVAELKERLEDARKNPSAIRSESGAYEMPATNKELTKKLEAYHRFTSEYVTRSLVEKHEAVRAAEKKMTEKYEAILAELRSETSSGVAP